MTLLAQKILDEHGPDIDREKWTVPKAVAIFRLALARAMGKKAVAHFDNILEFGGELDKFLRGENSLLPRDQNADPGVVSFDFDKTLAVKDGKDVHDLFVPLLTKLIRHEFTVVIISNKVCDAHTAPRYERLLQMGAHLVTHIPAKPSGGAFDKIIEVAALARGKSVAPSEVVHVGDNFFTDGGALLKGIQFVRVNDVTLARLTAWSKEVA